MIVDYSHLVKIEGWIMIILQHVFTLLHLKLFIKTASVIS